MLRSHRNSQPPLPDLSRTFWKPPFPEGEDFVVRREHPILKWGDYNDATGLYIWQNERWTGNPGPLHMRKGKQALKGMTYGVENNPRCGRCEKLDRCCTTVVGNVPGTTTCARCRLGSDKGCCFANGGLRTSNTTDTTKEPLRIQNDEDGERSNHQPPVMHHRSSTTHGRDNETIEEPDHQPPAKRQKISSLKSRSIVQEDSDDDLPIKAIFGQRKAKARHGANTMQPRSKSPTPQNTIQVASSQSKHRRQTVIDIQDSPPSSPLFCPTSEPPELDQAHSIEADIQQNDLSTITSAADYAQIQERLRALEAENYQHQAEKRQDRVQILKLQEQIFVLREQQNHKLEERIREVNQRVNYAVNQLMIHQLRKAGVRQ
ncbi:hypothetical protein KCU65_g5525, partial [Aureobasidium melanogenum]